MSQNEFNSRTKKIFLESKSLWLSQPVYVPLLGTAVAKLYHLGTAGNSFDVAQSSINRHVCLSFSFILNQVPTMLKYIFLSPRPLGPGPSWIGAPLPNSYATAANPSLKWEGFGYSSDASPVRIENFDWKPLNLSSRPLRNRPNN